MPSSGSDEHEGVDGSMPPGLVVLANAAAGVMLVAAACSSRLFRLLSRRSAALAALPLLIATLLSVYVFGEDSYRRNGISRWDAYRSPGGALGSMFVLYGGVRCCAGTRRSGG